MSTVLGLVVDTDNGEEIILRRHGTVVVIDVRRADDLTDSLFYIELGQNETAAIAAALKTLGVVA